jgi:hypothetical protein
LAKGERKGADPTVRLQSKGCGARLRPRRHWPTPMSFHFGIDAADAAASGLDEFNADEGFKAVSFDGVLSYRLLSVARGAYRHYPFCSAPANSSAAP